MAVIGIYRLINGIYKYKDYAARGKLVHNIVGEYEIEYDTLRFTPYLFEKDTLMYDNLGKLVFDSQTINQLNDTDNNRIYKRIKAKR